MNQLKNVISNWLSSFNSEQSFMIVICAFLVLVLGLGLILGRTGDNIAGGNVTINHNYYYQGTDRSE